MITSENVPKVTVKSIYIKPVIYRTMHAEENVRVSKIMGKILFPKVTLTLPSILTFKNDA